MTRITPKVTNKFRELVLYIAAKSADDPRFGAVKLNKILYYADFIAYRRLRRPITDAEYQNLREGPAPRHMLVALDELTAHGDMELEIRDYFNNKQKRVKPRRDPKDVFSKDELQIVDEVIEELRPLNAQEVTDRSHREFGWKTTTLGETIPYRTAWISSEPLTEEQIEACWGMARRRGLLASTG